MSLRPFALPVAVSSSGTFLRSRNLSQSRQIYP
jgi:hypothetical protein